MKNKIGIIVLFTLQALAIPFALLAGLMLLFSIVSLTETDWTQIKVFIQSIVALITMLIGVSYLGTYTFSLIKTVNNKKVSLISWLLSLSPEFNQYQYSQGDYLKIFAWYDEGNLKPLLKATMVDVTCK